MRTGSLVASLVVFAAVALGTGACGSASVQKAGVIARASTGSDSDNSARGSSACALVREGIDSFNQGDFDATVASFSRAVPLAKKQVEAHDTKATEQLLEAVTYYAELAPGDYLQAAQSSPDFQKYKMITLGQCESGAQAPPSPTTPGLKV